MTPKVSFLFLKWNKYVNSKFIIIRLLTNCYRIEWSIHKKVRLFFMINVSVFISEAIEYYEMMAPKLGTHVVNK